jgi:hypothetical protein
LAVGCWVVVTISSCHHYTFPKNISLKNLYISKERFVYIYIYNKEGIVPLQTTFVIFSLEEIMAIFLLCSVFQRIPCIFQATALLWSDKMLVQIC